jgi:Mn2+/Fe2+ NRAMP family transporter
MSNENQTLPAPTHLKGIISHLGPGMILAGSIVGSGELIATTRTGAEANFSFLWLILIGCIIKVFTQIELARYAISSGKTTLVMLNEVPGPKMHGGNLIIWYWFLMFIATLAQQGGIVGGVGQALAISAPLTEQGKFYNEILDNKVSLEVSKNMLAAYQDGRLKSSPDALEKTKARVDSLETLVSSQKSDAESGSNDAKIWAAILTFVACILLVWGNFSFIEKFCMFLVCSFSVITIYNLFALQSKPEWAVTMKEFLDGMSFGFPDVSDAEKAAGKSPLGTALMTFGIIGVGASELLAYPYWCLEKGYGKHVGPKEEGDKWLTRAKGWLKVMQFDAWGSMFVYTFCTLAFYLLGAAILGRTGLVPEGTEMIRTLSVMYEPVFGKSAQMIFLVGAFAVLFSTFFVAIAAQSRLFVDVTNLLGIIKLEDEAKRVKYVKVCNVLFAVISLLFFMYVEKPVVLVMISGAMQSLMLPMLGASVLYFRYKKTDKRLLAGKAWDLFLWISFACFAVIGFYLLYGTLT